MNYRNIISVIILVFFTLSLFAQNKNKEKEHSQKETSKVKIENSDRVSFAVSEGITYFSGNCRFFHEGATMYCDSAEYYEKDNKLNAFGNVKIIQNDTIRINSKILKYDGNKNIAQLYETVSMTDGHLVLTTEYLIYNTLTKVGQYPNKGKIVSKTDVLTSEVGYFYSQLNEAHFKDSVNIKSSQALIKSDTLKYNTKLQKSNFFGPTHIYTNNDYLYTEKGWYDTKKDLSSSVLNSKYNSESKAITADTIFYDKFKGKGWARGNIIFIDTVQLLYMKGNYGEFDNVEKNGYVTSRPLVYIIDKDVQDTLFLAADTIRTKLVSTMKNRIKNLKDSVLVDSLHLSSLSARLNRQHNRWLYLDSIQICDNYDKKAIASFDSIRFDKFNLYKKNYRDSLIYVGLDSLTVDSLYKKHNIDYQFVRTQYYPPLYTPWEVLNPEPIIVDTTISRVITAYKNVRIYKTDMQAVADSLVFTYSDSTMRFYQIPAIWSNGSQMTANQIDMELKNKKIDKMRLINNGLIVNIEGDSSLYNQITGRNMVAYFKENKLQKMIVIGNSESIYYPKEDSITYTGMNYSLSSNMNIYFNAGKLSKIRMDKDSEGVMYPLYKIPMGKELLNNFVWRPNERPIDKNDLYRIVPKNEAVSTSSLKKKKTPKKAETNIDTTTIDNQNIDKQNSVNN